MIGPRSSILRVNQGGVLVDPRLNRQLGEPWQEAICRVVVLYKECFGADLHSVYLRGSAAIGEAITGISDLDTFCVVNTNPFPDACKQLLRNTKKLARFFPEIRGIETGALSRSQAVDRRGVYPFIIKVLSRSLFGNNLAEIIAPFSPGRETMLHAPWLGLDLQRAKNALSDFGRRQNVHREKEHMDYVPAMSYVEVNASGESLSKVCEWIAKRIVRSGFELVMERERCYTRDLYLCCSIFAKYYPEKALLMEQVLEWAIPSSAHNNELVEFSPAST